MSALTSFRRLIQKVMKTFILLLFLFVVYFMLSPPVRFMGYIWSKRQENGILHLALQKCFITVVSCPCFLWNLAHTSQDPYLRPLFLPQNDREWKKQENLKACVLFPSQVRETKKERNLPGEQDNSQHTRLIV